MKNKFLSLLGVIVMGVFVLGGCVAEQTTAQLESVPPIPTTEQSMMRSSPPPRLPAVAQTRGGSGQDSGLAIRDDKLAVDLDPEEIAQSFAYYQLDNVQMVVVGEQAIEEYELTDEVTQHIREHFSELGMRVQNAGGTSFTQNTHDAIRAFAASLDADLVTVVSGIAQERAQLGQMFSYEAEIRTTIYEASGDIVATKEITKIGSRSSRPDHAAHSALRAAAEELGPYLSEQLIRRVGQNLITRRLNISGLKYHASVTKLMAWLKQQDGINDVRLISWDADSDTARFIMYLQPTAKDNLGTYITTTPDLNTQIRRINQAGTAGTERSITR